MATTTNWLPNPDAIWSINCGLRTAAELMDNLSHPAANNALASANSLTPPPTVKGILICRAIRFTSSTSVFRFS